MQYPKYELPPLTAIQTWSAEALGGNCAALRNNGGWQFLAALIWPVANLALFIPFRLYKRVTATRINTSIVLANGNLDVGIYGREGNLIVAAGGVGQAGVLAAGGWVNIADTIIGPGIFYMALVADNIVGTFIRQVLWGNIAPAILGMAEMANAYPLPNPAVMTQITGNYIPQIVVTFAPRTW